LKPAFVLSSASLRRALVLQCVYELQVYEMKLTLYFILWLTLQLPLGAERELELYNFNYFYNYQISICPLLIAVE
jgi:hypothetical protein